MEKNFAPFPQINTYIDENELNVDDNILDVMKCHESIHREEITYYFLGLEEFKRNHLFINNPSVLSSIDDLPSEDNLIQEQFIDFTNDGAQNMFSVKFLVAMFGL